MALIIIAAFVLGLIVGSFLNVLILRLPARKSINGRSQCPHCKHVLSAADLVPVFSYLFLRGRCRHCGARISPRYFYIEAATGGLFAFCAVFFTPLDLQSALLFLRAAFIVSVLVVVFMTDLEHFLILDKVVLPSAAALLVLNFAIDWFQKNRLQNSLSWFGILSAIGAALFFGSIYFFSKGKWLGLGDVKFSLFLGLATPFPFIIVNLILAYALGAIIGLALIFFGRKKFSSRIPFGTFLALSTIVALFYGPALVNWYARAIGIYGIRY